MGYKDRTSANQKIALERIDKLFSEAESNFLEHPQLSQRYMELSQKLSTRYKVRLTKDQKRKFCKKCYTYLKTGITSRTRIVKGRIVVTCLGCGNVKRMVYRK